MKERPVYFCTECGNESPKWVGKCPACGAWNTLVEQAPEQLRARRVTILNRTTGQEIPAVADLTDREVDILIAGGQLRMVRSRKAQSEKEVS